MIRRWDIDVANGDLYFDGRLYAREVPNLPSIFAMQARADLKHGAQKAREAAIIEMSELCAPDIGRDPEDDR